MKSEVNGQKSGYTGCLQSVMYATLPVLKINRMLRPSTADIGKQKNLDCRWKIEFQTFSLWR